MTVASATLLLHLPALKVKEVAVCKASGAAAVAYLHSQGMLHRDLKPANVLLCSGNPPVCKLCDFGISKRTRRTKKQKFTTSGIQGNDAEDADTTSELCSRMSSASHLEMAPRTSFNNIGDLSYGAGGGSLGSEGGLMTLNVGTLSYMAPELRSDENYGRGVDVWRDTSPDSTEDSRQTRESLELRRP